MEIYAHLDMTQNRYIPRAMEDLKEFWKHVSSIDAKIHYKAVVCTLHATAFLRARWNEFVTIYSDMRKAQRQIYIKRVSSQEIANPVSEIAKQIDIFTIMM